MQNEFINFKNKIFLVTGSNGFIGKNLCKKLRSLKATVIETDIHERKNNKFFIKADLNNYFRQLAKARISEKTTEKLLSYFGGES